MTTLLVVTANDVVTVLAVALVCASFLAFLLEYVAGYDKGKKTGKNQFCDNFLEEK